MRDKGTIPVARDARTTLPTFDGFPYLVTRVVPAMYRANRLQTSLVLGPDAAIFVTSDGTEHLSHRCPP
jgi:hypothetical protein